jgi:hypothetical protein
MVAPLSSRKLQENGGEGNRAKPPYYLLRLLSTGVVIVLGGSFHFGTVIE